MEASKVSDTELKIMVLRMVKELNKNFHSIERTLKPYKRTNQK